MYDEMDWYREALKRDPGDTRTNTAVGNNYLKKGDYISARKYLSKAIKRLTNDYTRPSTCEALYLEGLTLKALKLYDEAVDTLYRATWDYAYHSAAYFQLAQISVMKGDLELALKQINESLWTNARNNRAVALKAAILRKMDDFEGAISTLNSIDNSDPLDFRIKNEHYLIAHEAGNLQKAKELLATLNTEMRDFHENYLELAVGYINDGLLSEAEDALHRFSGNNPLFDYYLGYVAAVRGEKDEASKYFKMGAEKPVDYVFPHRFETVEVMKTALKLNPDDGKAYYYIGNILYDHQPEYAIVNWEKAVEKNPTLAIAYRNLGWGYYRHFKDIPKAVIYYEKAISLNNEEAIYYTELSDLYEIENTPIETRLKLFQGNNETVKKRDDAFIWQIKVLTLAGQPDKAVEYLDGVEFAYREGSSTVKEAGNERLGNREIQVNYYIGLAYEALNQKSNAETFFQKAAGPESNKITGIMDYYKGLSYKKLNENKKAQKVFDAMTEYANEKIQGGDTSETGVIFGGRDAENVRKSLFYTIKGLGNKGLDKLNKATEDLQKAVELSQSNLWAQVELKEI